MLNGSGPSSPNMGDRLHEVRINVYGPNSVNQVADALGMTPQAWRNIGQIGELITATQLLGFALLTGANPVWLLRGEGPRYRSLSRPVSDLPRGGNRL